MIPKKHCEKKKEKNEIKYNKYSTVKLLTSLVKTHCFLNNSNTVFKILVFFFLPYK